MEKIKNYVRIIKWLIKNLSVIRSKDYIVLIGTPLHGNIGDQAIALAEYQFLLQKCNYSDVLEIPSRLSTNISLFKLFVGDRTILIHGGGFIGTLYPREEEMVRNVIKAFPNNKIVILPQTVDFSEDDLGTREKSISASIYNNHKRLYICTREKASFKLAKEIFPKCSIYLIPDMVLQLEYSSEKSNAREGVLLCLRDDKERTVSDEEIEIIQKEITGKLNENIKFTDTNVVAYISEEDRERAVSEKIEEFAKAKLVITDRLHGMVLAAIANTPCIALNNINGKVSGVYDWIKNNDYVYFATDNSEINRLIDKLKNNTQCTFSTEHLNKYFDELKEIVVDY